jgi:propionate CoA-transferase
MPIDGEDFLFYKAFPIHVGIIRGTTADSDGNVTMEREALTLEAQAIAMAAHNSGGIVIAQVERIAERNTLNPRQVKIPGVLVDCVVVAEKPEYHMQTFIEPYSAAFSGEIRVPISAVAPMALDERKIIARRAAMELAANDVVNLGIGMPEGIANVATEEKILDLITLTAEPGVIGGVPAGRAQFRRGDQYPGHRRPAQPVRFLRRRRPRYRLSRPGPGRPRRQPQRLEVRPQAGRRRRLHQHQPEREEGGLRRHFHRRQARNRARSRRPEDPRRRQGDEVRANEVEHRTFSGPVAAASGKTVLYITERCVFRLCAEGLELIEIAPGVDLQRDILDRMEFAPIMRQPPALMDARIFAPEPMGLRPGLLEMPLEQRLSYDAGRTCSSSISRACRYAAAPTSIASWPRWSHAWRRSATRWRPSSTTTASASRRN